MKLLIAFLFSSANALARFRDNAMLLNTSSTANFTPTSVTSPSSNSSVAATPMSPLATSINESWMNVFNDRSASKPTFSLGIDPTIGLGNNANVSVPLPGFVLLQYLLAQRAEIVPVYYQLTAFLFRQLPSDETMEQTEVRRSVRPNSMVIVSLVVSSWTWKSCWNRSISMSPRRQLHLRPLPPDPNSNTNSMSVRFFSRWFETWPHR